MLIKYLMKYKLKNKLKKIFIFNWNFLTKFNYTNYKNKKIQLEFNLSTSN